MVVMPGGVDIHSHLASSACNHGRRMLPEEHAADPAPAPALDPAEPAARSGTGGTLPSTFTTGYRYAGLGYTTVFDAAVAPITARHTHQEFDDTPIVDGGFFVLLGNDEYLLRQVDAGERDRARDYAAWMIGATGAYAIKMVNPGGIQAWKSGQRNLTAVDQPLGSTRAHPARDPRDADRRGERARAAAPGAHPLQQPGHAGQRRDTTIETMEALDGRRAHYTHLQFHCYGKTADGGWVSAANQVIEYVNSQSAGQRGRGPGDVRPGHHPQRRRSGRVPAAREQRAQVGQHRRGAGDRVRHRPLRATTSGRPSRRSSGPWGSSCFLLSEDPWRVVLSTDHPNGGSFLAYPALIQLLMDRAVRDSPAQAGEPEAARGERAGRRPLAGVHAERDRDHHPCRARPGCWASGTRVTSAIGADADVTVYARDPRHRAHVRHAPLRGERRGARGRGGPAPARAGRPAPADGPRLRRHRPARPAPPLRRLRHGGVRQLSRCGTCATPPLEIG